MSGTKRGPEASKDPAASRQLPALPDEAEKVSNDVLPEGIKQVLGRVHLPPPDRQELVSVIKRELFSGPLPHPHHLGQYAEIIPDGANRVMLMAEAEQKHRHIMESRVMGAEEKALEGEIKYGNLGVKTAFAVALILIVGAIYCVHMGIAWLAPLFIAAPAFGVVRKLIDGRGAASKEAPPSPKAEPLDKKSGGKRR